MNQVYQEVEKAAESLYDKKTEAALPIEEKAAKAAEELAQELEQNLEKWMPDTPDSTKWAMEDFPNAPEAPLAELPAELEDIIGDLIDSEESLTEDVEDATSEALASPDKGAGWGAGGGPISSMAAKGITGNMMPNSNEVGGRSGEGRSGQSSGQMVGDTAEGKSGRPTPTRLDATPFEQGAVADSSKEETGGATGGGKVSGFDMEGLRGPAPAPLQLQDVPRLAEQQARIRQAAEKLAMELRRYNLPSGDIEIAVRAMIKLENAAARGEGIGMKQLHNRALDALKDSRQAIRIETGLRHEQTRLPPGLRTEILSGLRDGTPAGYEEVISEYFRAVAQEQDGEQK